MSDQAQSNSSPAKTALTSLAILISFGFLVLILTSNTGRESIEERAYKGEFSADVTEARWANLEEVTAAQSALVDSAKVDAALKDLAKSVPAAVKSDIVVPGSPTFMKQAEEAAAAEAAAAEEKAAAESDEPAEDNKAAPAGEEKAPEADAPKEGDAPAKVEEKPAAEPKKEEKPKGASKGAKGKGDKGKGKGKEEA